MMKKRILFVSSLNISDKKLEYDGVTKKIMLEIVTLNSFGFAVDYLFADTGIVYIQRSVGDVDIVTDQLPSFHKTMVHVFRILRKDLHYRSMNYDFIYMRYEHISFSMLLFLRDLKKEIPTIEIIAELPTYMEKWEPGSSFCGKLNFILKRCLNEFLPKSIDKMVTFDDQCKIFGIPTIPIENFVDVSSLPVKKRINQSADLHLLGVAMMTPSHGFDRVIRGLRVYYNSNVQMKVYFHIVGAGLVKEKWENLTRSLDLQEFVIFEGIRKGEELDELFDSCHVGIASLAIFRKKCKKASELKIREYLSRGLPFIYSALEPLIENQYFCLKVPHDESAIDIGSVICFYKEIMEKSYDKDMRVFAENECNCNKQFEKIFKK